MGDQTFPFTGNVPGYAAAADYTSRMYRMVYRSAANVATLADGGTSSHGRQILGSLVGNLPYTAEACSICGGGLPFPAVLNGNSANIAAGAAIKSTTGGLGILAAVTDDIVVGYLVGEPVTTDGVTRMLHPVPPGTLIA